MCIMIVKKGKQFIHLKDERNVWEAIFRTPTYNVIPLKLKIAVSADPLYSMSRWSKLLLYFDKTKKSGETSTSAFIEAILDLTRCDS